MSKFIDDITSVTLPIAFITIFIAINNTILSNGIQLIKMKDIIEIKINGENKIIIV